MYRRGLVFRDAARLVNVNAAEWMRERDSCRLVRVYWAGGEAFREVAVVDRSGRFSSMYK